MANALSKLFRPKTAREKKIDHKAAMAKYRSGGDSIPPRPPNPMRNQYRWDEELQATVKVEKT